MKDAPYYGDKLSVLLESIANESVDLVYLDPPFATLRPHSPQGTITRLASASLAGLT